MDDGNQPDVARNVVGFGQQTGIRVRYIGQLNRRGPAAARNCGWRAAQASIIAFTDDDCIPQPDWLRAALALFDQGATVVTGQLRMPLPDQPTHHDWTTALLETAEFITANCFCVRSALNAVGGFEEAFDMAWREDSDLQFKLLRSGYRIQTCPDAVVIHPMREAPWYASLRDERKNRYDALLYKRHPLLFQQRVPGYRPLVRRYYGIVISGLVGVAGGLTGHMGVTALGVGSWLVLEMGLLANRWPTGKPTVRQIWQTLLIALATPFLSVYWRLYGAFTYRVIYL